MLARRVLQFLALYALAFSTLLLIKYSLGLSHYVIPPPGDVWHIFASEHRRYISDALDTFAVAVLGQAVSICLAFAVGIIGRQATLFGSLVKVTAYNVQAYPIVALAPILFILLGDGFLTRLLIAAMICYFPLLLSILGIMSEPVADVEHFYRSTGTMRWQLEVKIRAFENIGKLITVFTGSATLAMAGTIVAEFIAADAGIGYSIRIALYQSDLAKVLVALFLIGIMVSLYQGLLEWAGQSIQRRWRRGEGLPEGSAGGRT